MLRSPHSKTRHAFLDSVTIVTYCRIFSLRETFQKNVGVMPTPRLLFTPWPFCWNCCLEDYRSSLISQNSDISAFRYLPLRVLWFLFLEIFSCLLWHYVVALLVGHPPGFPFSVGCPKGTPFVLFSALPLSNSQHVGSSWVTVHLYVSLLSRVLCWNFHLQAGPDLLEVLCTLNCGFFRETLSTFLELCCYFGILSFVCVIKTPPKQILSSTHFVHCPLCFALCLN